MKSIFSYLLVKVFLLISLNSFGQEITKGLRTILDDSSLSTLDKELQLDDFLNNYSSEYQDSLINDTYEVVKWYARKKKLDRAIVWGKKNIKLIKSAGHVDTDLYRKNLYSLGYCLTTDGQNEEALVVFKQLLDYEEPDNFVCRSTFSIGEIYFNKGKYYSAREYYTLCKTISKDINNPSLFVRSAIGEGQSNKLINTRKSLNFGIIILKDAIRFADSINATSSKSIIKSKYIFDLYNQLGNLHIDRLDYNFEQGRINLEKALNIAQEMNSSRRIGTVYNDLGVLYLKDKRVEALDYLNKALDYNIDIYTTSLIYRNLGEHYLNFENYEKAIQQVQTSLKVLVKLDTSSVRNLPSKLDLVKSDAKFQVILALIDKANLWIELGKKQPNNKHYLDDAIATLNLADFVVEQFRLENVNNNSKLFWRKTASEIYHKATKVSFLLNEPESALYYMEKSKALLLLEDIALKTNRNSAKIPEDITNQEQKLTNEIRRLEGLKATNDNNAIQSQFLLAKDNYNKFINSLNPEFKLYFKTLEPASVVHIDDFRKNLLEDDNTYIEYIIPEDEDEEGYGLILTSTSTQLFEIKDCKTLKNLVITYRELIDSPITDKESLKQFNTVSNTIYQLLFPESIRPLIKDKTLTIVPDYFLQNIPFEALTTSAEDLNYLIYTNEINYSYSLTFLNENRKTERDNNKNIIAFAPVEFPSGLISLPDTNEELSFIDKTFRANIFLKNDALKAKFFKESNNYEVIHIASHANANDSISPWIQFYDQKVSLEDLYKLENSAELVVLSACNTSLGELHHGEGVMSLSRGFFNTGSHSVMPTLWEVNDKATLTLVKSFYNNLKKGENKSQALHNAKLEYLKNNSLSNASPYFWASFVLIGDSKAVNLSHGYSYYYYLGIAILLIIIILYSLNKKKRNT